MTTMVSFDQTFIFGGVVHKDENLIRGILPIKLLGNWELVGKVNRSSNALHFNASKRNYRKGIIKTNIRKSRVSGEEESSIIILPITTWIHHHSTNYELA